MAKYQITGPDGHKYELEGPDGASDNDIIQQVFKAYPDAVPSGTIQDLKSGEFDLNSTPQPAPVGKPVSAAERHTENLWSIPNQGGWGISDETKKAIAGPDISLREGPLSLLRHGAAEIADYGIRPFQALQAGAGEIASAVDEVARQTGLADALSNEGGKFLPGTAAMGLAEAIPDPSLLGAAPNIASRITHNARLAPDVEQGLEDMFRQGTADQILKYAQDAGANIDAEAVRKFVLDRDKAGKADTTVRYEGTPIEGEPGLPGAVGVEGEPGIPGPRFREKPEGSTPRTVEAVVKRDVEEIPQNVQEIADYATEVDKYWKNAPDTEVYEHFDDADGLDPNYLGVYDPESGKIWLNSKAIEAEAKSRNISVPEMTNTVMFHEGLGHYGLAQKFRDELDSVLEKWYEGSSWFKKQTDDWLEKNAGTYPDEENLIARAGEEILAEISENGVIPRKMLNDFKNKIKDIARDFGFNWKVSEREIRTVLAQAHDAVINGRKADVVGNGFRAMSTARRGEAVQKAIDETAKRFQIRDVEKALTEPDFRAQVKMTLEQNGHPQSLLDRTGPRPMAVKKSSASSNPDRFKIMDDTFVTPRKEAVGTFLNELGVFNPGEIRKMSVEDATKAAERLGIDKEWVDYFNDRRLGVKTPQPDMSKYAPSFSIKKSMRRTVGSGSEGPLQGKSVSEAREQKGLASPIGKVRSEKNIEDILNEAMPEKTKESWDEWIDDAGRIRMTEKAAQALSRGAEVPELLAAQQFATKSANRIRALQDKARNGTLTPREANLLGREIRRLDNVAQSIAEVRTNAGRILNSAKIVTEEDAMLQDGIRKMMASGHDLDTPEGVAAALKQLDVDAKTKKKIDNLYRVSAEIINLPRSLMSSMDLSAPFRQGLFFVSKPQFWKSLPGMFKMFGSERAFKGLIKEIQNRPSYKLMEEAGLYIDELGDSLTKREEQFLSTWAEKIPVAGAFVRASGRGYAGFLNKLRADVFDDLVNKSKTAGVDFTDNPKALDDIASYVNNATGRGTLPKGKWERALPALAGALFSPRLMVSRLQMLNPVYYAKLSPVVRKDAIKSLLALGGIALTVTSLAKAGRADVEADPRSSDFAKIKIGDTRYDILGGFGQYLTLGARLITNQTKNAKKDVKTLGDGYKADTRLDVIGKFGRNKLAPIPSLFADYFDGKDGAGQPFSAPKAVINRITPLVAQDAYDLIQEQGVVKGGAMAVPSVFGVGSQTYPAPPGRDRLGRLFSEERDRNDPVEVEVNRLEEQLGSPVFTEPKKSRQVDGETVPMTEEEVDKYHELSGRWIKEDIQEEMNTPEWKTYSDEEKVDIIKDIVKEARKDAREEIFN